MHKFMGIVIAFIFVLSYPGIAPAVDENVPAQKTKTAKQITGEVAEIDLQAKTVSVKGKNGTVSAGLTDKTKVMLNNETKTLGDVHPGDRVTMKYREADGRKTAKSIELKSNAKKPKTPG